MATHTWADLHIPEAERLADLAGISADLEHARAMAQALLKDMESEAPNHLLHEPYSIAIVVKYCRAFTDGARAWLGKEDLDAAMTDLQKSRHRHFDLLRDKHIAHSVNAFEENVVHARYCEERVRDEGITSISYRHSRISSLSSPELHGLIELTTVMLGHVESKIRKEQERLLKIVRNMDLDMVLKGGQKAFLSNPNVQLDKSRKKGPKKQKKSKERNP